MGCPAGSCSDFMSWVGEGIKALLKSLDVWQIANIYE